MWHQLEHCLTALYFQLFVLVKQLQHLRYAEGQTAQGKVIGNACTCAKQWKVEQ